MLGCRDPPGWGNMTRPSVSRTASYGTASQILTIAQHARRSMAVVQKPGITRPGRLLAPRFRGPSAAADTRFKPRFALGSVLGSVLAYVLGSVLGSALGSVLKCEKAWRPHLQALLKHRQLSGDAEAAGKSGIKRSVLYPGVEE